MALGAPLKKVETVGYNQYNTGGAFVKLKTCLQRTFSTGLQRQYVLEPVAVGTPLNEAPLQTTELLNVGEAAVSYKVDSNGIKRANSSQGHGMPVRLILRPVWENLALRI